MDSLLLDGWIVELLVLKTMLEEWGVFWGSFKPDLKIFLPAWLFDVLGTEEIDVWQIGGQRQCSPGVGTICFSLVSDMSLCHTHWLYITYTLYILHIYCSGNCQYSFAFISFYTFYTPSKYSLHIVVQRFPLYSSAVHYVTHRVPQCNDHLHRFHCLPRTYIHMCDFPMIIISLKFQVRCDTGFICFPWFRVFEGC